MPLYEYECPSCQHAWNDLQGLSDPLPECPECHEKIVHKVVSATSFRLKGPGWAADGYEKAPKP